MRLTDFKKKILFSAACVFALSTFSTMEAKQLSQCETIDFDSLPSVKMVRDTTAVTNIFPAALTYAKMPRIFYGFKTEPESFLPANLDILQTRLPHYYRAEEVLADSSIFIDPYMEQMSIEELYPVAFQDDPTPYWLTGNVLARKRMYNNFYQQMVENPSSIEYAYWKLPEPVKLTEEDPGFISFLRRQKIALPEVPEKIEPNEQKKFHWLHVFNSGIQLSQAYISPNWYQGGNNHLAFIFNFLWDVQLNQVFHPNLMFQSTVSYKLGLNSQSQDQYHKYAISEDLFQWNMKFGLKAFKKWYYTVTSQFKTQFLHNYPENSLVRTASFLSPGDLNIGLGMSYSTQNKKKTWTFNASISPLSYNLKTCIDRNVDPVQFNIPLGRKTANEIGSSGELTMLWKISSNITYNTRLFLFTDYKYFQGDWENTLSFTINKFLSTQIYVHCRYDSSSELTNQKWKHFMLKEILSFGFSYNFSTK